MPLDAIDYHRVVDTVFSMDAHLTKRDTMVLQRDIAALKEQESELQTHRCKLTTTI